MGFLKSPTENCHCPTDELLLISLFHRDSQRSTPKLPGQIGLKTGEIQQLKMKNRHYRQLTLPLWQNCHAVFTYFQLDLSFVQR